MYNKPGRKLQIGRFGMVCGRGGAGEIPEGGRFGEGRRSIGGDVERAGEVKEDKKGPLRAAPPATDRFDGSGRYLTTTSIDSSFPVGRCSLVTSTIWMVCSPGGSGPISWTPLRSFTMLGFCPSTEI